MTAALAPAPAGLLLRLCAFLAAVVPWRTRNGWQWYRRAIGGRWSRHIDGSTWCRAKRCPGALVSEILGGAPVPVGVCFDEREACLEDGDGNPLRSDAHECHCAGWG